MLGFMVTGGRFRSLLPSGKIAIVGNGDGDGDGVKYTNGAEVVVAWRWKY